MATQEQFKSFLKDIEPSTTTKKRAQDAHKALRKFLLNHEDFNDLIENIYLSGSYKRNTAIRPQVKNGEEERPDVDIIVVTKHTLKDEPKDVLELLFKTLKEKYQDIRKQTRSVGIFTSTADMDVVPVILPDEVIGTMYIPDRKLEIWLVTNPPRHTEWTTEVNEQAEGRFKPLVKLFKWWRRQNPTISNKPKGFMLECLVAECMDYNETQYEDLFIVTLENMISRYESYIDSESVPHIDDPGVPGNNVLSNVTPSAFSGFLKKVEDTIELARKAQEEDDPLKELEIWREIFGERFPAPESMKELGERMRNSIFSGGISVNPSSGRVEVSNNPQSNVSYQPQRFHGDKN